MKMTIVVGLFVLVSCLHHQVNARFLRLKVECEKPKGLEDTCHRYICDEVTGESHADTCPSACLACAEGQVVESVPEDLTKPYPDCCPHIYCRDP